MKASYLIAGLFLLAGAATGCDDIKEEDRYIKVEKPVIDNPKTLLIMEFTGNNCKNCPLAAALVEEIKEDESPKKVISVGLHPYGNYNTEPMLTIHHEAEQDLRSQAATAIYDYYGKPNGFPTAIFNGLASSMSGTQSDWKQKASEALTVSTYISIEAACRYDDSSRNLTVDYSIEFLDDMKRDLNVTVWLVENKILGTQMMPNGKLDFNYEHNHVLRASLNGNWGEKLNPPFNEGEKKEGSASMTLKEDWVAENCDVVIFVYRDDNKEVEQATSICVEEN